MDATWRKNYLRYKSFFLNMLSQYQQRSDWKAYLEILLSLGTISIFAIFALKPTVLTIAGLIKDIDQKKQTIERMDNKIQNLSKAQIVYDQQRGNIALLDEIAIPKSTNSDIFSRQIEGLSSKNQTPVSNINLGKGLVKGAEAIFNSSAQDSNAMPMPDGANGSQFSVSVVSGVDQYQFLNAFLSDFNNLRQPPQIDRLEIKKEQSNDKNTESLTLTISGRLPYMPQQK